MSVFLASLVVDATPATKGFEKSGCDVLGGDFETVVGSEPVGVAGVVGLEENFELMLDIHEFRRPIGAAFGSFWLLGEFGPGSTLSELAR